MPGLKLLAEIGLDGSGYEAGLKHAEAAAHRFSESIKGFVIGAVGIATLEQALSKTVETAKELVETSKRLSIAPEQLQLLRQAAKNSGVELDQVAGFLEKIDIARERALQGGGRGRTLMGDFGALGITPAMLHSQTAAQLAMGPLARTATSRNAEELGAVFADLGLKAREFGPMIPVLKTDFEELGKNMKDVGGIMDAETAVSLKNLSDETTLVSQIMTAQLGPALIKLIEVIYEGTLKLAKGTAGLAGFYGAGLAGTGRAPSPGLLGQAAILAKTAGLGALHLVGAISTDTLKKGMVKAGFNLPEATKAVPIAQAPWVAALDQFKSLLSKFAAEAEALKHPKSADFSKSSVPDKVLNKALQTPSDSLTKVGNFLGGMGITGRIEQQKIQLQTRIAIAVEKLAAHQQKPQGAAISPTAIAHLATASIFFPHS